MIRMKNDRIEQVLPREESTPEKSIPCAVRGNLHGEA